MPLLSDMQKGSCSFHKRFFQFAILMHASEGEDDFALFRVLGRGGFGLVNGCKKCQLANCMR